MSALLTISALSRHFGGLVAVSAVDMEIAGGSVHGLIGPNGAGKTTLLNLVSGHLPSTAGRVRFQDGDITRWPNALFDDELMRLEHWTNATEQGVHAARTLLTDSPQPFAPVPFVWSDQYDRKIQTVGLVSADADLHTAHGSYAERQFVSLFGRGGRIVGALGFNRPRQVMQYRRLIAERASWDTALELANA